MDLKDEIVGSDQNIATDDPAAPPTTLAEPLTSQKLLEHTDHSNLDANTQSVAQDSGYNSSRSSGHHSPPETPSGDMEDGERIQARSRASSRTSVSSIPASVLTNLPDGLKPLNMRDVQEYMFQAWDHHGARPVHTIRQREAMFRKPSSVRAMQMHTEDEGDEDFLTPPKRRGSQRISDISVRSAGSSPFKRSPFYSPTGAAAKPKAKKEYPLVLLHCTLLQPSLPVPGLVGHIGRQKILREVLPTVYWKRWKLLEEKIGSGVLRDRGVLISHPEEMYDLLEERLLESLDLQHPRLDHGHFLGREETESDREDRLATEDSSTEDEGEECPDCGARVVRHDTTRKWEVKVFAANGLMRAGAWAAAWNEMEKVDVEVGLWLPPDVRADLEKRLIEESSSHIDNGLPLSLLQGQENLLVGAPVRAPTPSPQITEPPPRVTQERERSPSPASSRVSSQGKKEWDLRASKRSEEIDLHTLLLNYIRVLASDRRNVAIVFLSVLIGFVAFNSRSVQSPSDLRPFPRDIPEYTTSSVVPPQQHATQTWTENTSSQTVAVASSDLIPTVASTPIPEILSNLDDFSDIQAEPPLAELEDVSPTTDAPSVEATHAIYGEQEDSTSGRKDESEDISATTAEIRSADSIYDVSRGVEELTEVSELALLEGPLSSATSLADFGDDQILFAYEQHEQSEPSGQDQQDGQQKEEKQKEEKQNEKQNEENEENERHDI
ncbi:hypothetical protein BDV12DRAFT_164577 [Aspergillus spectabilis]